MLLRLLLLSSSLALSALANHEEGHLTGTKVGTLRSMHHGVRGVVYAIDDHTILVKDFEYDGAGPDAFFWVGTEGEPGPVGTILPYPFEGKYYEYEDKSAPILTGRFNKVDVKLTLPSKTKVTDLKWFSVWCRQFKVNFADVIFPPNFKLDPSGGETIRGEGEEAHDDDSSVKFDNDQGGAGAGGHEHDLHHDDAGEEQEHDGLPPPLKPPTGNSQPGHRDHGEDPDVQPEGEAKPNRSKYGGTNGAGALNASLLAVLVAPLLLVSSIRRW
jgi:hypothetical protein